MPGNIYTLYGDAMHQAFAFNYRQKIKSKKDLGYKEVVAKFQEVFDKGVKGGEIDLMRVDPKIMRLQAENVIAAYMKDMAPKIQPAAVELEFRIELKNFKGVIFFGFIDVVTVDDVIIDHKTAGPSTIKDWTQAKVDNEVQFTVYSAAFRKLFKRRERAVRVDVIPRMDKPKFVSIYSKRDDMQLQKLFNLAEKIVVMGEKDCFYPNVNNCKDCQFKSTCPGE
jgi:CRISPR/Cas system-associated exonuclease Cas4 (RecB family)